MTDHGTKSPGGVPVTTAPPATDHAAGTRSAAAATVAPMLGASERLVSLDVFRGMTIAGMILVNNAGTWQAIYPALRHAAWDGCTPTDLIFPFFLFIVGVAITYSFAKRIARGDSKKKLFIQIVRRSIIIYLLGLLLNGFSTFDFAAAGSDGVFTAIGKDLSTLRVVGVLNRIAFCYFLAGTSFLLLKQRGRVILTVSLLWFYFILMKFIPVPGGGTGILDKVGNWGQYIDSHLIAGHMWSLSKIWDPEALLGTFPALATTFLGIFTGEYLRSNKSPLEKISAMYFLGVIGLIGGIIWDMWFPINKALWTSSYVLYTGGMALLFLATCYYLIDVKKITWWTKPFVIYGMNAIAVYVLSGIVAVLFIRIKIGGAEGKGVSLHEVSYNFFASFASPINASLLWALSYVIVWLGIMWVFYKKKIFIKV